MNIRNNGEICVPHAFDSPAEAVAGYEYELEKRISALAERAVEDCDREGIRLLSLAGPTCAGKTTAATKLTEGLRARGYAVHIVSLDDFYYDHETLHKMAEENGGFLDYDSVNVMDLPLLSACIEGLMEKGEAQVPVYDFESGKNDKRRTVRAQKDKKNIYFFEGIQAVYPEISPMLRRYPSKSMFISVMRGISVDGVNFSPEEIRLCRRIVRDSDRRGATPQFTLSLWDGVRANEESSIFPYAGECDYFADTALGYELHVLYPYLVPLLQSVERDCKVFEVADGLLQKLTGIVGIPSSLLPQNSLYYEFITPVVS
ncbi:MAG: hypothetical protein E7589_01075 [Ruminococcaceae bacterium]|nr:hypothetical protein [Oscillospiraceae bacterium]